MTVDLSRALVARPERELISVREPKIPTRPVTRGHAAEHWFRCPKATLDNAIRRGTRAARQVTDRTWEFDLDEVTERNPTARDDADLDRWPGAKRAKSA